MMWPPVQTERMAHAARSPGRLLLRVEPTNTRIDAGCEGETGLVPRFARFLEWHGRTFLVWSGPPAAYDTAGSARLKLRVVAALAASSGLAARATAKRRARYSLEQSRVVAAERFQFWR